MCSPHVLFTVSDVLKGRPSVTSTMSEFTPRPDDGRPPTQRSLSCDYTGTDSEMDADMSSTEEGEDDVFMGNTLHDWHA